MSGSISSIQTDKGGKELLFFFWQMNEQPYYNAYIYGINRKLKSVS